MPTKILVVDDSKLARMSLAKLLNGLRPSWIRLEAANADEAVAILESRSDIALLFTDIQMPGSMDGLGLARTVQDRWPTIKIILVSGRMELSERDRPANSRFFRKPFSMKQITEGLQDMIRSGEVQPARGLNS